MKRIIICLSFIIFQSYQCPIWADDDDDDIEVIDSSDTEWDDEKGGKITTRIKGDVNGDGKVNIVDVTSTISHILGQTPDGFQETAADINGDGIINIVDVTSIIDIILK